MNDLKRNKHGVLMVVSRGSDVETLILFGCRNASRLPGLRAQSRQADRLRERPQPPFALFDRLVTFVDHAQQALSGRRDRAPG